MAAATAGGGYAGFMKLQVETPEDVYRSLRVPRAEVEETLRVELAVALYQRGARALGKARQLAGMTRWEFHELLGRRRVARHYTGEDLDEDIAHARGGE
jgi:predicted HTH domain antitoxin